MNERQYKLARMLIDHDNFLPTSFYSKKLLVSTKTVYQDLEALKLFMKPYVIQIKRLPSVGIKLIGEEQEKRAFITAIEDCLNMDNYSPNIRRLRIIKDVCLEKETPTLEKLSKRFMVSKTSLYNDIKHINQIISHNEVVLSSNSEGLVVNGSEFLVQKALKQLIFHYSTILSSNSFKENLDNFFEIELIDNVYKLLLEDLHDLTTKVSDYYIRSLITNLLIQFRRLEIGHHLTAEESFLFSSIHYMETYSVANEIIAELEKKMNLHFDDNDKEYLSRQLFAHRITNNLKVDNEKYTDIVYRLIERMSTIEKIDLTQNEHLFNSLLYHIPAMVLRLKKGIRIENPLLESIKSQYSELFSIVWYALVIIEKEYDVILNDDEISLILIHFQIALDSQSKANNILIVCQHGLSSAQFIYSKIRRFIPARDNVEISTLEKLEKADPTDIDLIITSLDINHPMIPHVKVTPLVNSDDYVRMMEAYTKYLIKGEKFGEVNTLQSNVASPTLLKFMDPDLIRLSVKVDSKEECLDLMISELERMGHVNKRFRKSVCDREKLGNTNLESGAALPHADPSTVITSHIFFLSLKNAINWGDRNIKLVIMINLCEKDILEIRDVVEELYHFIENEESVDVMSNITKPEEILKLFSSEGD